MCIAKFRIWSQLSADFTISPLKTKAFFVRFGYPVNYGTGYGAIVGDSMQFSYHARLKRDAERWVEKGIVSEPVAQSLVRESLSQKKGYAFSTIVIFLGIVCLCFAAMTFVAANWEDMPRILRVILLLTALFAAYAAAVWFQMREREAVADALVLLGSGIFGAAIMLVGQMYHMQGAAEDAVMLWACGTLLAAAALRSTGALWLAIALFIIWLWFDIKPSLSTTKAEISFIYPLTWLACAAVAWWLAARRSAQLLAIGLIFWIAITLAILTERHDTGTFVAAFYLVSFLTLGFALLALEYGRLLKGFEPSVVGYLCAIIVVITAIWIAIVSFDAGGRDLARAVKSFHFVPLIPIFLLTCALAAMAYVRNSSKFYDLCFCAIWSGVALLLITPAGVSVPFFAEAYALGLSIWLIRMGWRQEIPYVSRLGYGAFAVMMLLIYFRTAGSLLGTSGFYLTAGILMVAGAFFGPKLLRKLKPTGASQ